LTIVNESTTRVKPIQTGKLLVSTLAFQQSIVLVSKMKYIASC